MTVTDQNLSMFTLGMIWIKSYFCQVIKKDGRNLFKRDLVLLEIKFSFLGVPVKLHGLLYIQCMYLSRWLLFFPGWAKNTLPDALLFYWTQCLWLKANMGTNKPLDIIFAKFLADLSWDISGTNKHPNGLHRSFIGTTLTLDLLTGQGASFRQLPQ